MNPPDDIAVCLHRMGSHKQTCHCKHPDIANGRPQVVKWDQCRGCELQGEPVVTLTAPKIANKSDGKWKLGDQVSAALAMIGVTEESVTAWVGAPCGCSERREKLNSLSEWVQTVAKKTVEAARTELAGIVGR